MRFEDGRQSQNIEDRRGRRPAFGRAGFGGRGPALSGLGIGGLVIVLALGYFLTGDPMGLLTDPGVGGGISDGAPSGAGAEPTDAAARFVGQVLLDTEETWQALFSQDGQRYAEPALVLFDGQVASACGLNSSAVGPFYCPGDRKVYIDLGFYRDLERQFGAPGDFAQAYVIAHEVGHHVQNVLGIFDRAARDRRASPGAANAISVRQELQADCFAGVWGHFASRRGLLEPGDLEEGLTAAAAIGDDRIQRRAQGQVTPETWTHGSSADRVRWFRTGFEAGRTDACDTFATR
jgi:hypothetical protein